MMANSYLRSLNIIGNLTNKLLLVIILSAFLSSCSSSNISSLPDVPNWAKPTNTINKIKGIFSKDDQRDN